MQTVIIGWKESPNQLISTIYLKGYFKLSLWKVCFLAINHGFYGGRNLKKTPFNQIYFMSGLLFNLNVILVKALTNKCQIILTTQLQSDGLRITTRYKCNWQDFH